MGNIKNYLGIAGGCLLALASCAGNKTASRTVSGLDPAAFDTTLNGKKVELITLKNSNGMEVCLTNYGGRVVSLCVPDKNGKATDVVLGYDNIRQYADTLNSPSDFGSSVGRYANRIKNAQITVGGKVYKLRANDNENTLHGGGNTGWLHQVYDIQAKTDSSVTFAITAPDGENGFPGTVKATATYLVKEVMYINADKFTPSDAKYIPTGEIRDVTGTPMDFRKPHAIQKTITDTTYDQIHNATGYDHNWCLNTFKNGKGDDTQVAASLFSPKTGILLEVFTNEPGLQVYTGNFQGTGIPCKHGIKYPKHVSVCFESQKYPDSPTKINQKAKGWEISNPFLKPGQTYYSHLVYKFSVKK